MTRRSGVMGQGSTQDHESPLKPTPTPIELRASDSISPANPARVYDYWLGGKDHFPVDRKVGDSIAELLPWIVAVVRANRRFLVRAVDYLAGEMEVDQFVDLGSGLPTSQNVHEVLQRVRPGGRTVYVDHDPVVLAYARAMLECDPNTRVVDGDLRDPVSILTDPRVGAVVDWARPVAVLMVAVLHFVADAEEPRASVAAFRDAMAPGSFLVVSHACPGPAARPGRMREAVSVYEQFAAPFTPRTVDQVARLLEGFDLVEPGLVPVDRWRPPGRTPPRRAVAGAEYGVAGVGRVRSPRPGRPLERARAVTPR